MSDTADLIHRYYAAFNAQDSDAMLALLSDDVQHDVNQGDSRHGRDAFRAFLTHMDRCYEERCEQLVVMVSPDGTRAAAEFMVHGTYKARDGDLPEAEGQTYVLPAGGFFAIEGDRITRVTTYYNMTDWTRQVTG